MEELPKERDEEVMLGGMGSEAANVHLGTPAQIKLVLRDLDKRKSNWLRDAAKDMAKVVEHEWRDFKHA